MEEVEREICDAFKSPEVVSFVYVIDLKGSAAAQW